MPAASRVHKAPECPDQASRTLADGVLARNVRAIAKGITLIESSRREDRAPADALLETLLPHTGGSFRIGVTGAPGAGKSTFIEALGLHLIARGHRVAVLAVDPTSADLGGLDPRRQDADGTPRARAERVHPPKSLGRNAGRRRAHGLAKRSRCARRQATTS